MAKNKPATRPNHAAEAETFDPNLPIDPAQVAEVPAETASTVETRSASDCAGNDQFPLKNPEGSDDLQTEKQGEPRGTVLLELPPLVELTEGERSGYASAHVQVQLRGDEAYRMKQLVKSMQAANIRLNGGDGPHVRSAADAIRWLVQQIGV